MPAIDERARHELFEAVHDRLGPDHADTLMSLLPPVGWADVATKHDLHELEARIDRRFESVDVRFEALEHKIMGKIERSQAELTRTLMFGTIGALASMTSLCLATIVLTR